VRAEKLDSVRNEIMQIRRDVRAQQREIRMLQRVDIPTASAELLLKRMRARLDDLCRERDVTALDFRQWSHSQGQFPTRRRNLHGLVRL